ncbi:alpha/beta hydrolase [Halioxenophilus aromaticivorans]|uniref:Alpha/beta hydrolase n=1 Tax=Halioxenophilus aromaticivorans TaxID=1306992 RepID=A0AAV3U5P3_9ALTE
MTPSPSFASLANSWPAFSFASHPQVLAALHQQYLEYYQLTFDQQSLARSYHFGQAQAGSFDIAVQVWQPVAKVKGSVFIVHGYWDHVGLYHHLIAECLAAGFTVVAFDEPGHGLSTGERAAIASFEQYTDALTAVMAVANEAPQPWVGIGQSTGGAVLLRHFFSGEPPLADTILLAPLVRASRWYWLVAGHTVLSPVLKKFPRDMKVCGSHDPAYAEFLRQDSLQYGYASSLWVGAMRQWVREFMAFSPKKGKMLYIQGDQDGTVDWRFNLAAVQARVPELTISLLEGAYHNLVNEAESFRQQALTALRQRLNAM